MQTIQHFEEEELYALLEAAEVTPENYLSRMTLSVLVKIESSTPINF